MTKIDDGITATLQDLEQENRELRKRVADYEQFDCWQGMGEQNRELRAENERLKRAGNELALRLEMEGSAYSRVVVIRRWREALK